MGLAAAVASHKEPKFRWGELEDDDGGSGGDVDLSHLLPPRVVVGPDADGLRKVIEYRFDDGGNKVKVTTTTRTRSLPCARLSRGAVECRSWTKFGDASACDDDGSHLTMVSTEEVLLERPRAPGSNPVSRSSSDREFLKLYNQLQGKGMRNQLVIHCIRQHQKVLFSWFAEPVGKGVITGPRSAPTRTSLHRQKVLSTGLLLPMAWQHQVVLVGKHMFLQTRKKVLMQMESMMRRRNEENSIRVNNLSEDTLEPDLLDLFSPFGPVSRVYLATDRKTGFSREFGFVNFVHREDGEKAISKLNGYGYDNLILRVEWSERPN